MTESAKKTTHGFQTEVKQLLQLMIHSLYSHPEIFIRELISNASDAIDRLNFAALSKSDMLAGGGELGIWIDIDKEGKKITVRDNGIGMSEEEVKSHLGTIAKSGTKAFMEALTGDQQKDAKLIGQFGVGFYSSFMVADRVEVITRRADLPTSAGVKWASDGQGEYTLESIEREARGTEVILHLNDKPGAEFLDPWRVRTLVNTYSDHISVPIFMQKGPDIDEDGKETQSEGYEKVNTGTALWTRARKDVKKEEYEEFYSHIAHDYSKPLAWSHNKVEGNQNFTSLLFIPDTAPLDLWEREPKSGLKLYIQRVFIMDSSDMLPAYLRFIKGVIDSNDLPLNVSREILQHSPLVDKIRASNVKKILSLLDKMAKSDPEKYQKFWQNFGSVIKEGPGEDATNREQISNLLRFASTHNSDEAQTVSLADYVSRMQPEQKHIYYVVAENYNAAKNSPHLEVFRKKGIEVLLLSDRVDEWLTAHLTEFDGKSLQSITKGELELDEDEKREQETAQKDFESVIKQMQEALGDKVKEVRLTHRLTDSPSCIVVDQDGMSLHLQRLMQQAGQTMPASAPILEINPEHRLVSALKEEADDERFADWAALLFDQALLAEGSKLDNPMEFIKRVNRYL